jgi:hypothetical protein
VAGPHRLAVRAVDPAGNVDPTPAVRRFLVEPPGLVEVATLRPLRLKRGRIKVPVTCHARKRCRGTLLLDLILPRRLRAAAADVEGTPSRKGRRIRIGRKRRFTLASRTRRPVPVSVSETGRRLIRRHKRLRGRAVILLQTKQGLRKSTWPVKLAAPRV